MKFNKILVVLFGLFLINSVTLFAQRKEMTQEEWQSEMNRLTERKATLVAELNTLKSDVASLKKTKDAMLTFDACMDELYALVGATKADVDNFRKQLNVLSGKIDGQEAPKADRQAELDAMKKNKISALPEFFNKVHDQLQRKLDAWVVAPTEIAYTVVKGDHLWGIAKKSEHYNNPFAWPNIYKANRDQIKNPDLIYPKQTFKIPNLTEEEKSQYDKIRRNYKPAPPTQTAN